MLIATAERIIKKLSVCCEKCSLFNIFKIHFCVIFTVIIKAVVTPNIALRGKEAGRLTKLAYKHRMIAFFIVFKAGPEFIERFN